MQLSAFSLFAPTVPGTAFTKSTQWRVEQKGSLSVLLKASWEGTSNGERGKDGESHAKAQW